MRTQSGVLLWVIVLGACQAAPNEDYQTEMRDRIINGEIEKYEIAKRVNGPGPDLCVAAGAVAAEYFYYKDEEHYREWTAIKERDCDYPMK